MAGDNKQNGFPIRELGSPEVEYKTFAAVLAGDDDEAMARLQALDLDRLRLFHFQIDRLRTVIYNVRKNKMKDEDHKAKREAAPKRKTDAGDK